MSCPALVSHSPPVQEGNTRIDVSSASTLVMAHLNPKPTLLPPLSPVAEHSESRPSRPSTVVSCRTLLPCPVLPSPPIHTPLAEPLQAAACSPLRNSSWGTHACMYSLHIPPAMPSPAKIRDPQLTTTYTCEVVPFAVTALQEGNACIDVDVSSPPGAAYLLPPLKSQISAAQDIPRRAMNLTSCLDNLSSPWPAFASPSLSC
ncbi:hypothetical protein C8R46DRAFT_1233707 [Mycena filopes]|nr:hypothetical protein C8R46DRAFT_1233707 [Mycena filopes]